MGNGVSMQVSPTVPSATGSGSAPRSAPLHRRFPSSALRRPRPDALPVCNGDGVGEKCGTRQAVETDNLFKELAANVYSFDVAIEKVDKVVAHLKGFQSARTPVITPALEFLFAYTTRKYSSQQNEQWAEKLNRCGIVEIVQRLWPSFWSPDLLQCAAKDTGDGVENDNITLENFWFICRIIWNGSDCSPALCLALTEAGTIEEMLKIMARKDFFPQKLRGDEVRSYLCKAATGVLMNVLRHQRDQARPHVRADNGLITIQAYLPCDVQIVATKCAIILAYSMHEDDADTQLVARLDDSIRLIVNKLLRPCVERSTHRACGFTLYETLLAVNALAEHDANKKKIVHFGALPLLLKVVEAKRAVKELHQACRTFWLISFVPELRDDIKSLEGAIESLTNLAKHNDPAVSKCATGALWNITGNLNDHDTANSHENDTRHPKAMEKIAAPSQLPKLKSKAGDKSKKVAGMRRSASLETHESADKHSDKSDTERGHVMISYDHKHKELAHLLHAKLDQAGYDTWIDSTNLTGSTLQAMAEAVEQSSAVVVCFSQRYQTSANCRAEAEYAFRLEKTIIPVRMEKFQPYGWLGMILGTKFYCSLIQDSDLDMCARKLIKQLGDIGKKVAESDHADEIIDTKTHKSAKPPNGRKSPTSDVKATQQHDPPKDTHPEPKTSNLSQSHNHTEAHKPADTNHKDPTESRSTSAPPPPMIAESEGLGLPPWTNAQVLAALRRQRLGHLVRHFVDFDGPLLLQLKNMYDKSPNVFYENANHKLGATQLKDVLRLTQLLDSIQ